METKYNGTSITTIKYNGQDVNEMYYNDVLVFSAHTYTWRKYTIRDRYTEEYKGRTGNPFYIISQKTKYMPSKPNIVNGKFDMSGGTYNSIRESNTPVGTYCAANSDSMRIVSSEDDSVRYPDYYGVVVSISDVKVWIATTGANAVADIYGINHTQEPDTYIGDVTSRDPNAYPANGVQGGYYYILQS